jgi:hypothetical protein
MKFSDSKDLLGKTPKLYKISGAGRGQHDICVLWVNRVRTN